jgi:hypothetical protein
VARASRTDELVRCVACGLEAQAASYEVLGLMDERGAGGVSVGNPAAAPMAAAAGAAAPKTLGEALGEALPPSDLRVGRSEDGDGGGELGEERGALEWELRVEGAEGREFRESALARNRAAFTAVTTVFSSVLAVGLLILGISKHLYEGEGMDEREGSVERIRSPVAGEPTLDEQMEQHLAAIRVAEVVGEAEEAAKRFLAAGSAQERLELVHEPERYREEVERFQELYPGGLTLEGELDMEGIARLEEDGAHIVLFLARTRESRGEPKLFLVQETEGAPFKVDWQYFHQFHEGTLQSFLDGEVGMEGEFFLEFTRVHARGEIPPFGDHSLAYRIIGIESQDMYSYFFVDERTGLGQAIRDSVGWQRAGATRVRLRWERPEEGSERRAPFLRLTWMQDYL